MREIRGKFLIRIGRDRATNKKVIVLAGVAEPTNFDINEIDDNDEMWVADILISGGLRFSEKEKGSDGSLSLEDFIRGKFQHPMHWNKKEHL